MSNFLATQVSNPVCSPRGEGPGTASEEGTFEGRQSQIMASSPGACGRCQVAATAHLCLSLGWGWAKLLGPHWIPGSWYAPAGKGGHGACILCLLESRGDEVQGGNGLCVVWEPGERLRVCVLFKSQVSLVHHVHSRALRVLSAFHAPGPLQGVGVCVDPGAPHQQGAGSHWAAGPQGGRDRFPGAGA